ncbi:hypothetical protein EDB86DRAFT_677802 [Lactarius hatsudake]|nr:hypothetical protein EDB86DRAFT_677802 [Lactarius hatsudake]
MVLLLNTHRLLVPIPMNLPLRPHAPRRLSEQHRHRLVSRHLHPPSHRKSVNQSTTRMVTVALPTGAAADVPGEAKSGAAMATADKHVPSNTTDASNATEAAGGATVPDSPGDESANFAPTSSEAESAQAQKITPEEVVADSKPNKDPIPPSTSTRAPADATSAPPVPEKDPAPEKGATVTKERAPTAEPAASVSSEPNGEPEAPNAPDADAEKASGILARSETPLATQGNGEKPDGVATEPALQFSQSGEAGSEKPTTKGDDAKPEGLVKPVLRLDLFREISIASTVCASGPGTPVDEIPLSSLEQEDDGEASGAKLSKNQKKRLRERARKQAQGDETNTSQKKTKQKRQKNTLHPPSGEPPKSVGDSVVQEPRPVATAPVDIPVCGQGVLVDVKTESSEDDAPVILEKPDAAVSPAPAEKVFDDASDDAEWSW